MILHGYFILGNIGETEEEMLAVAPFARELGLDTLALSSLRNERYSGLEELVARNPGYHIGPDGKIYSDEYPPERLRRIWHEVSRRFYTPRQMRRVLWKLVRNRVITPGVIRRLPRFLVRKALELRRQRKARRARERSAARAR